MSGMLTFCSKNNDLIVIDLALNIFRFRQKYHNDNLSFDQNIMLDSYWIDKLKDEISILQKENPTALIGISMEFIHSCKDNGAFLHFARDIPNAARVFFYHILPECDLQTRMFSDLKCSGASPDFDKDFAILFLAKGKGIDRKTLVERCERLILSQLEEIVRKVVSKQEHPELLASSSVYADRYVDIKRLFMTPQDLLLVVYYMSRQLLAIDKEYDALVATSKNGAILAGLLGKMTGNEVVFCVNIGPQYALPPNAVERFQPQKRYMYVYDFICLGTEAKLLHALVASRHAVLVGGVGVASYIPLSNPELCEKHSPLADIKCLVDLLSAGIPYHIFIQKDAADSQLGPT